MGSEERTFPIQADWSPEKRKWIPASRIPWAMIQPHEATALKNHQQSLETLAQRGGLSSCEAVAILEDRAWSEIENSEDILLKKVAKWNLID